MNSLCSLERLQLALAGRLNAEEESLLNRHLDDCPECAAALEQLSGGSQASDEVASMLTPDGLDDAWPLREECSITDFVVDHLEPSDAPEALGKLGGYDIFEVIGRGGMGVVLKGYDRELKRFVAIKALAPHLAHSTLARKRFAREAQAAAAVVNLHVIAIHHVQPNGKLPFLVMPLLTGESLAQRLKAKGALELNEALRVGMQAADGLAAAHAQGLIHRDIKPANILLEKGVERAVLTDFGLARAADDVSMTRQGIIAGTPEYMSPEQARGEPLDGRSDLFSLGCVLYEMATGVSPFRTDSTMATLRRIVDEQPPAMSSLVPELPPWFCHIVERLLSKDPSQRFASASDVKQLLAECLSHLQQPSSVSLPDSLVPYASKRQSLHRLLKEIMKANLFTDKDGVRHWHWLRIFLISALAPASMMLIGIVTGFAWTSGAFWVFTLMSWGAFAGGLIRAARSYPGTQQIPLVSGSGTGTETKTLGSTFGSNAMMICGCLMGLVSAVALAVGGNICESILKVLLFRPTAAVSEGNLLVDLGTRLVHLSWAPLGVAAGMALTLVGLRVATRRSGRPMVVNRLLLVTAITAGLGAFEMKSSVGQTWVVMLEGRHFRPADDPEAFLSWSVPAATRGWLMLALAQATLTAATIAQVRSRIPPSSQSPRRSIEDLAVIVLVGLFGLIVSWSWLSHGMVFERMRDQTAFNAQEIVTQLTQVLSSTEWGAWALMASMTVLAVTHVWGNSRKAMFGMIGTPLLGLALLQTMQAPQPQSNIPAAANTAGDHTPAESELPHRETVSLASGQDNQPGSQRIREGLVTVKFKGMIDQSSITSSGIGWVIDEEGHILVPSHVAPAGDEEQIELRYSNGTHCSAKRVKAIGQLAFLKSDQVINASPISLNNDGAISQGDSVTAILDGTGIVSGKVTNAEKTMVISEMAGVKVSPPLRFQDVITTDIKRDEASLSGAPLLTKSGDIAGMILLMQEGELPVIPASELLVACDQFRQVVAGGTDSASKEPNTPKNSELTYSVKIVGDIAEITASANLPYTLVQSIVQQLVQDSGIKEVKFVTLPGSSDEELRAITWEQFDLTQGQYWRALSDAGRYSEAADLIERMLGLHPELNTGLGAINGANLQFHAAQCRAFAGDKDSALKHIALAQHGRPTPGLLWSEYLDGTAAFLRGDKVALQAARDKLAAGNENDQINRAVLDRLIENFGQPYLDAYGMNKKVPDAPLPVQLQGKWRLTASTAGTRQGQLETVTDLAHQYWHILFQGKTVEMVFGFGEIVPCEFSINSKHVPAHIDMTWMVPGSKVTMLGLIEVTKDTLRLALGQPGNRPIELGPATGVDYYEFQRINDATSRPVKFYVASEREFEASIRERTELERRDVFLGATSNPLFTAEDCISAELIDSAEGLLGIRIQFRAGTVERLKKHTALAPDTLFAVSSLDRESGIYCALTHTSWKGCVAVFQGVRNANVGKRIVAAIQREIDKSATRPQMGNPILDKFPYPNQLFKNPGVSAEASAFRPAPEAEQKKLDGLWDIVEVSFMGQAWITRGAQQVLIENGKWLGYDPHEPFENETQNVRREFLIGNDNTFEQVRTEGKATRRYPGHYKWDGDRLWLAIQECSLPSETPIRAIPTIVESNVTYYQLQRRNPAVKAPASNTKNTALVNTHSIDAMTHIYNDSTARLRRELFQPPIPDLTVEQMRSGLKLAAEAQTREGRSKTAKVLQDFAETGTLPQMGGFLFSYGTHEVDESGVTTARLIVPTFAIATEDKSEPDGEAGVPVVLTSLSLIYEKNGYVSRTYEDSSAKGKDVELPKQ